MYQLSSALIQVCTSYQAFYFKNVPVIKRLNLSLHQLSPALKHKQLIHLTCITQVMSSSEPFWPTCYKINQLDPLPEYGVERHLQIHTA